MFNVKFGNFMNKILRLLFVSCGLVVGAAQAGTITVGGVSTGSEGQTSAIGTCTVNFNNGNANNDCNAIYTGTTSGNFVSGSSTGQFAAPVGDTSIYLSVGPSSGSQSVTVSLANQANYFGFYSGSLDNYNTVQFFLNNVLVDSFTGADINAVAFPTSPTDGNQNQAAYVNYFPTVGNSQAFFDKVVYSSSSNAFETDNHSFGVASISVPEPGSLALMSIAGLAMLLGFRRKQG